MGRGITMDGSAFAGLRSVLVGEDVGPSGPKRNLTALNRVEHESPEEMIEAENFPQTIKVAAGGEGVGAGGLERVAVAVQAEIIRVGEPMKGQWPVAYRQSPRFQKGELLLKSGGRFRHSGSHPEGKKVTRLVRIVERRGGCC
jgi:hypothetical protein